MKTRILLTIAASCLAIGIGCQTPALVAGIDGPTPAPSPSVRPTVAPTATVPPPPPPTTTPRVVLSPTRLAAAPTSPPPATALPTPPPAPPPPSPTTRAAPTPTAARPVSAQPTPGNIRLLRPAAGIPVTSPVRVEGSARVYEGHVEIEVLDASGAVVGRGSTTATAGAPALGTFAVEVPFRVSTAQTGSIRAFSLSPRDGSRQDVATLAVRLVPGGNAYASAGAGPS